MDFSSLKDQLANISLYDVKAAVRKAQNVVMNYTEMEAKVREATNNEPWGASSTLMQEIANGTYNYQLLNEIMPMIYKRFTEKSAEEWRQIYKALQLLEFLVKNGAEQVIDDARSHIGTIKMLRQFHYIDMNGKDQGINVRNRAKELGDLLSDVDRIRAERKKARATKNKYGGVEGGSGGGFSGFSGGSGSSRYGGFGSDSGEYGGYSSNTVYGDGGGFGGASSRGYQDEGAGNAGAWRMSGSQQQKFEEYDEYDEGAAPRIGVQASSNVRRTSSASGSVSGSRASTTLPPPKKTSSAPPPMDLIFDEPLAGLSKPAAQSAKNPMDEFDDFTSATTNNADDDDDFDDFQAAPPPAAASTSTKSNLSSNLSSLYASPPPHPGSPVQVSTSSGPTFASPQPRSSQQAANISGLVGMTTPNIQKSAYAPPPITAAPSTSNTFSSFATHAPSSSSSSTPVPGATINMPYQPAQPNYFASSTMKPAGSGMAMGGMGGMGGMGSMSVLAPQSTGGLKKPGTPTTSGKLATTKPKSANDAFGAIWTSAVAAGIKKPPSTGTAGKSAGPQQAQKVSLAEMAKEKAQSGLWGSSTAAGAGGSVGGFGMYGSAGAGMGGMSGMGGMGGGGATQQQKKHGDLDDLLG